MRAKHAGEEGFTLIEVLMTVMIMGIVFVGILSGIFTSIVVTKDNRNRADADKYARVLAERLKTTVGDYAYKACATTSTYPGIPKDTVGQTPPVNPLGWRITIEKVEYWVDPGTSTASDTYSTTCTPINHIFGVTTQTPGTVDSGLQRITIKVQPPAVSYRANNVTMRLVVFKRDTRDDCNTTINPVPDSLVLPACP